MTEIINLRTARKRAEREKLAKEAAANRLTHGRSKADKAATAARNLKARRNLEGHRNGGGET